MRKVRFSKLRSSVFIIAALFATNAWGQVRLTESFASPVGGIPNGWSAQLLSAGNRAEVVAIGQTQGVQPLPALCIEREGSAPESGAVYFVGSSGGVGGSKIGDVNVSVLLRYNEGVYGQNLRGIVVRAKRLSYGDFGGYFIAVVPRGSGRALSIYYNPRNHVDSGTLMASVPLEDNLAVNTDYLLSVKCEGTTIETVLALPERDGSIKELAKAETTAATQSATGYVGLRGAYGNSGPIRTWFRQFHLSERGK